MNAGVVWRRHPRLDDIGPIGVMVPGNGSSYDRLQQVWDLLDRLCVSLVCMEDHLLSITDPAAHQFECWAVLAAMAERTSAPLISALVSPSALRNPALTAKASATLDVISGGRFILGLGAGWYAKEFTFAGIPFPPLQERLKCVQGVAQRCREIWSDPNLRPQPAEPGIPIMVGGRGRSTTLPVVAKVADIWNTEGPLSVWRDLNESVDSECCAIGRPAQSILRSVAIDRDEIDDIPNYRQAGVDLFVITVRPSMGDKEIEDIVGEARAAVDDVSGVSAPRRPDH